MTPNLQSEQYEQQTDSNNKQTSGRSNETQQCYESPRRSDSNSDDLTAERVVFVRRSGQGFILTFRLIFSFPNLIFPIAGGLRFPQPIVTLERQQDHCRERHTQYHLLRPIEGKTCRRHHKFEQGVNSQARQRGRDHRRSRLTA